MYTQYIRPSEISEFWFYVVNDQGFVYQYMYIVTQIVLYCTNGTYYAILNPMKFNNIGTVLHPQPTVQ